MYINGISLIIFDLKIFSKLSAKSIRVYLSFGISFRTIFLNIIIFLYKVELKWVFFASKLGGALLLIFCMHARSGPIWGVIYIEKMIIR